MGLGTVTVNNINQYQNSPDEVERRFVYIGKTSIAALQNVVTAVSSNTDLETLFTSEEAAKSTSKSSAKSAAAKTTDTTSYAYKDLLAAQVNAGQNWTAVFVGLADDGEWSDALDMVIKTKIGYEAVVICDPVTTAQQLEDAKTKMAEVQSKSAQYMWAMMRTLPIDNTPDPDPIVGDETGQAWTHYISALQALVNNFVAERVMCIPTLFENDLGILAGRLCNRVVTIADSPMRTATGTLIGMGSPSTDKTGAEMPDTIFATLDTSGFSVEQTYPGEKGWYWADGNTFDLETGDYKIIENLRVVLKACRQVYKIAVPTIADRSLNNSPKGIEKHKALYQKPLRVMSKGTQINGVPFPGEIYPPNDNSIEISWIDDKKVNISVTVRPYNSPKDITIGVGIDLSNNEEG